MVEDSAVHRAATPSLPAPAGARDSVASPLAGGIRDLDRVPRILKQVFTVRICIFGYLPIWSAI